MARRYGRALGAGLTALALLAPAVISTAGPQQRLDRVKQRLDDLRDRLAAERSQAGDLKSDIASVDRAINQLQIEINRLDGRVESLEADVEEAQAHIDRTQAHIDEVKGRAVSQAVRLYKSGATETLDVLLDSESLGDLDRRMQLLGVAARENTNALVAFGRLKIQIKTEKADLFAKKARLEGALDERELMLAERGKLRAELADKLGRVNRKIEKHKHHESGLERAAQRITQAILARQAPSVADLGISASGFIWPVNGPVTSGYGPRWGRMHTGIDIDGYTGQPIAASKAGRVILAEYYSGYGNAVIMDHGGGVATLYGHLSSFAVGVGAQVGQGQTLGAMGCTGSCTGDHLHFEIRLNGNPVDPMQYLP